MSKQNIHLLLILIESLCTTASNMAPLREYLDYSCAIVLIKPQQLNTLNVEHVTDNGARNILIHYSHSLHL